MQRPDPGTLLRGVHAGLEASVLPALEPGAAQRQLKAALHVLRRLERSWDRMPAYLEADNADVHATLAEVATTLGDEDLRAALRRLEVAGRPLDDATASGPPAVAAAAATPAERNERLHALLADTDAGARATGDAATLATLTALYRRMLDREARAWATD